jgi:hypothetical protein
MLATRAVSEFKKSGYFVIPSFIMRNNPRPRDRYPGKFIFFQNAF